jgi:hypothetical protein
MKKAIIVLSCILVVMFLIVGAYYFGNSTHSIETKQTVKAESKAETTEKLGCTRTTRLENDPQYDRALSLIHQKLDGWNPYNDPSMNYFPPASLVNCIKVVEGDVASTTGAEGFFEVNSENIKPNYFPVTVDEGYSYVDDLLNALIILHEITHVEQYIDEMNGEKELSCFDKEVEAFYASWKFIGILHSEEWKSITMRLENDDELHPQLQIVDAIKSKTLENFERDRQMCLYGEGKDDPFCVDNNRKQALREMLMEDDFYRRQCEI